MSFATITPTGATSQLLVTGGSLLEPLVGIWVASVAVDSDESLVGRGVTLRMGTTLERVGTVVNGGVYQGAGSYLVVGGFGGWRKPVPPDSYQGPLARLATIAEDAARLVGERVRVEADVTVGPFSRVAGPASQVLRLASSWWVDADGTTVIGPRPAGPISPRVLDVQLATRTARVEEEEVGGLLPGKLVVVDGFGSVPVRAAIHSMGGGTVLHV